MKKLGRGYPGIVNQTPDEGCLSRARCGGGVEGPLSNPISISALRSIATAEGSDLVGKDLSWPIPSSNQGLEETGGGVIGATEPSLSV